MKFVHFGNYNKQLGDDTEGHIDKALKELGQDVERVDYSAHALPDGDWLLFHNGCPKMDLVLSKKIKKAFWFFDKVKWGDRLGWVKNVARVVELGFLTDGTFVEECRYGNFRILRQGFGEDNSWPGRKMDFGANIAFVGSIYGERKHFIEQLYLWYGRTFRAFNDVFNRDLCDLCESVQVIVAPKYPMDDNYWSNRVYQILGSGGFLLHPRLKGLEKEYIDNVHLVYYDDLEDLRQKADYFLKNRQKCDIIRSSGQKKTLQDFTYAKRVETLLHEIRAYRKK